MPDYMDAVQENVARLNAKQIAKNLPALRNMSANEFCDDCGEDIPEPRRQAMPGAVYCVDCQVDHE